MINLSPLLFLLQTTPESSDILLQDGRMYSVLAVLLVIFGVLIAYLIVTERRVRAIEKKLK